MHTEEIIALLDNVKPAGNGSWTARCPNRDHRTARLSVKDAFVNILRGLLAEEPEEVAEAA